MTISSIILRFHKTGVRSINSKVILDKLSNSQDSSEKHACNKSIETVTYSQVDEELYLKDGLKLDIMSLEVKVM